MVNSINIHIILFSTFLLFHSINGNQEQCIGEGGSCKNNNDCCGDNIVCKGALFPKKGTCKKQCGLGGTPCPSTPNNQKGNCCNKCVHNQCVD